MDCKVYNAFEGCLEELAYQRPNLNDVDTEVFPNGIPLSKSLIEISGPSEAGKSMLVWRLMARCLAPTYFGGRNCDIIFIDMRHKFDIEHFERQIKSLVISSGEQHTASELEEVLERCLDSIHLLSCYSSKHFDAALEIADGLLMKHSDCAMIAIDGVDAFYWLDTYVRRIRMQTHYARNVDRLRSLCDRHGVCCAYTVDTNYLGAKRLKGIDGCAIDRGPLTTNNKVEHRLQLVLRKNALPNARVSTRVLPTYASFQQQGNDTNHNVQLTTTVTTTPLDWTTLSIPITTTTAPTIATSISPTLVSSSTSSVTTKASSQSSVSPEISISSLDRAEAEEHQLASTSNSQRIGLIRQQAGEENSDCECSDDELLATFSGRSLQRKNDAEVSNKDTLKTVEQDECTGNKSRASTDINCAEISSQSSFEELGAIGGISDESKAATDTNSSNLEQWQMLDNAALKTFGSPVAEQNLTVAFVPIVATPCSNILDENTDVPTTVGSTIPERPGFISGQGLSLPQHSPKFLGNFMRLQQQHENTEPNASKDLQVAVPLLRQEQASSQTPTAPQRLKKVTRRRSDSYLNRQRQQPASEVDSPTCNSVRKAPMTLHEQDMEQAGNDSGSDFREKGARSRGVGSCQRCGKHKATLRKQVEKMRRHLESAQLSEAEIKKEIQDFLSYLEQRTKSMECSDTETVGSSLSGRNFAQSPENRQSQTQHNIWEQASIPHWEYQLDDNEGIHVYAGSTSEISELNGLSARFINLEDFETIDELEGLSVKQLKEILMLNRVDYKGCCEKQELFDRVQRLWKNLKSAPAIDKLATDELCKICMDAPIECVILECGHMATCTNCGKVLSECPICRQYIVRVVRFFRA